MKHTRWCTAVMCTVSAPHLWFSEFLLTFPCTCQIGWARNTCFSHPWTWLFAPNDLTLRWNVIEYGNFSLRLFLCTVCFCRDTHTHSIRTHADKNTQGIIIHTALKNTLHYNMVKNTLHHRNLDCDWSAGVD